MTTGDFILGIVTSLIASILLQLRHKGCTLVKRLAVGTYANLSSNPILPFTLFVVTLFVLILPPVKVLAPAQYTIISVGKDSPLQRISYTVWKSTTTGKSYIFVTDGDVYYLPLLRAVDNYSPKS